MKKVIIIVLVLAVLGVGFYFVSRDSSPLVVSSNARMIEDAYLRGGSVICDFIDPGYENREDEEITVYIKAGKMRFLYENINEEEEVFSNIVFRDDYYYVWNEDGGMKMGVDRDDFFVPFGVEDGEFYVYPEEDFNLDCKKSSIDDSMFEIPTDIEFFDMTEMMEGFSPSDYDQGIDEEDYEMEEDFYLDPELLEGLKDVEGFEDFNIEDFLQ